MQQHDAETFLNGKICHLKKHKGEPWHAVMRDDLKYVQWAVKNVEHMDEEIRDALRVCCEW